MRRACDAVTSSPVHQLTTPARVPSVMNPLDEPDPAVAIAKEPAHRAIAERDVPLVAIPTLAVPPSAGGAPRARRLAHASSRHATPIDGHVRRPAALHRHADGDGRTEAPEREGGQLRPPRFVEQRRLRAGRWQLAADALLRKRD